MKLIDLDRLLDTYQQLVDNADPAVLDWDTAVVVATNAPVVEYVSKSLFEQMWKERDSALSRVTATPTGEWIVASTPRRPDRFRCSACDGYTDVATVMGKPVYRYCPWCGAKMKVEEYGRNTESPVDG